VVAIRFGLYLLAALTCMACAVLLGREYFRTRVRLLLWSTLCFAMLTINNVLLFFDLGVFPTSVDLRLLRLEASLLGMLFLLYGFLESDSGRGRR
jgi:hypothetical protein